MERETVTVTDALPDPDLWGRKVVAGLFTGREAAVAAIDELMTAGFSPNNVGMAIRDKRQQGGLADETGANAAGGALAGLSIPQAEAEHFEKGFRAGGVLVTVNGGDCVTDAAAVLRRHSPALRPPQSTRHVGKR